jgi:hypothetical protein
MRRRQTPTPIQFANDICAMSVTNSESDRGMGTLISSTSRAENKAPGFEKISAAIAKSVR